MDDRPTRGCAKPCAIAQEKKQFFSGPARAPHVSPGMIKSSSSGSLACALGACILSVACGAHPDDVGTEEAALSSKCAPAMPDPTLNAPAGNKLAFTLDAVGVQIYTCQASGWVFQAPEAT